MRATPISRGKAHATAESIVGLYHVALIAAVTATLYFGRELLVPLALAALLTFVLAPLVTRIERSVGRIAAISVVTSLGFILVAGLSWVLTRQAFDLVSQLPNYRTNIEKKLHSLEFSHDEKLKRFSTMLVELESEIPLFGTPSVEVAPQKRRAEAPVIVANTGPSPRLDPLGKLQLLVGPFFHATAIGGLVILLMIFMLLKREDLRGRIIKIAGQGKISSSTRVIEDAANRVSRYLITQLVVNTVFGCMVALGLYFIGVPNAFLWGVLAAVLRFIPYVGAWLAAFCPIVLALAVSPGWQMAVLTVGLFALLELVTANLVEPLLYGSSTGVSSLALIVAAIFWTWLWGPIGLLLSTPLTVCLAVLGKHVPKLAFFSVLLGNEEALSPAEECYHRLLIEGLTEAEKMIETYVRDNSLTALYDNVFIPTITLAEMDFHREELTEPQRLKVSQGIRDIVDDISSRPIPESQLEADQALIKDPPVKVFKADCRVVCVSTRSERDEISGMMVAHLLRQQGFEAITFEPGISAAQVSTGVEEFKADAVCISMVPPTTLTHVRQLCSKLRGGNKDLRIVVGIWGATENLEDAVKGLRLAGADEVVVSLAEAVVQFAKISENLIAPVRAAKTPTDDDVRIATLQSLTAYTEESNPVFDQITKKLARTFNVPIALVTFIDRDLQHFKAQFGLPPELESICDIPRQDSVCAYVVEDNAPLVVEDLSRDRRFAKSHLLRDNNFRFYAGVPLRALNGQPVGAVCVLDTKPRKFSEAELRLLSIFSVEASETLESLPVEKVA